MKKPKKVHWKVCRKNRKGQFVSCVVRNKLALVYEVGKWTKPQIGKCFVFGSKRSAESFARGYGRTFLLQCEVQNPSRLLSCTWTSRSAKSILAF